MTPDTIPIKPATQAVLFELSARTGQSVTELLDAAVEALRRSLATPPVASVPGVNPADVWEAAAQADAGQLAPHEAVFNKLRVPTGGPEVDPPGTTGDEQSDDPEAVARWIAAFDAIPPLQMTADEEAAWQSARLAQRRVDAAAFDRLVASLPGTRE